MAQSSLTFLRAPPVGLQVEFQEVGTLNAMCAQMPTAFPFPPLSSSTSVAAAFSLFGERGSVGLGATLVSVDKGENTSDQLSS